MKRLTFGLLAAILVVAFQTHAATWTPDKAHSEVAFTVTHMMLTKVMGTFDDYEATINFDPQHPEALSIEATIQAASVNTRNEKRDAHLRNADFFDVEKYPTLTFKSTKAEKTGDGQYKVTGDLTMHGVTKSVTLDVSGLNTVVKDPYGGTRTAALATTTISRKDFGLVWNVALESGGVLVSDDVAIQIDVQLVESK